MKILPNLISAARLAIAPFFFRALWQRQYGLALICIVVAGVSDGLDGFAARKLNAFSKFGAYIDPIADKILLSGAFLTLAIDGAIEKWIAILVFGRDILILLMAAAGFLFTTIRSFPPSWWGKASTTAQICYVCALLLHFVGFFPLFLVELGKWIAAAFAIWSGAHYIWLAWGMLKSRSILKT